MMLWVDEQELLLVQAVTRKPEWRDGEWRRGVFMPVAPLVERAPRSSIVHELMQALFDFRKG